MRPRDSRVRFASRIRIGRKEGSFLRGKGRLRLRLLIDLIAETSERGRLHLWGSMATQNTNSMACIIGSRKIFCDPTRSVTRAP